MKLLIEQYGYKKNVVAPLLDEHYFSELHDNVVQIPYVGYFLSHKIPDTVFILPKVFIIEGKAFGKYAPEDIIDFDTIDDSDKKNVFALSVWIYRAIKLYLERKEKGAEEAEVMQNVVSHQGNSSETMIDIVLSLLKFQKEHQQLFTYITRIKHSGQHNIHWQKTITRTQAVMQHGRPIYMNPLTRRKEVDNDEELIVLFFSVLNFLNEEYHFAFRPVFGYDLLSPSKIANMIETGKGSRILRDIRRKYFTDDMVRLWNLLYTFFEQSQNVRSKTDNNEQAMLVRDFNLVFEDMIDSLIGESNLPKGLKEQKDGKIIDHIYRDNSLIDTEDDIYFIGDSKYYKDENEIGANSIYKQYTYAKNVILYNVGVFDGKRQAEGEGLTYLDERTEGYNITPNFFIRGHLDKNELDDYSNNGLTKIGKDHMSYHFENRLFDRDTLILQTYNINFLFVLAAYVQGAGEHTKEIRSVFRKNIMEVLQSKYDFYAMAAHPDVNADVYIKTHFQQLLGKIFTPSSNDDILSLALDNEKVEENEKLKDELSKYFFLVDCKLGEDTSLKIQAARVAYTEQENFPSVANDDEIVLVGCIRNEAHWQWISSEQKYNIRIKTPRSNRDGAVMITKSMYLVSKIVLYPSIENKTMNGCYLFDLADKEAAPTTYSYQDMMIVDYPFNSSALENMQNKYLVYEIEESPQLLNIDMLQLRQWLDEKHKQATDIEMQCEGAPIITTFGELRNVLNQKMNSRSRKFKE